MIIEIRRHGEYDKRTWELTLKGKKEAKRMSKRNSYDKVFSGGISSRCLETAKIFGKKKPIVEFGFADIRQGEDTRKHISEAFRCIIRHSSAKERILIISHSNFIAAVSYFLDGKEIPQNLDDLPVIPYLKGIQINISKQKI